MVQIDLYTSHGTSEPNDNVFDADPHFNDNDDTSFLFDNHLYTSVNLGDFCHPLRFKANYESI